MVLDAAYHEVTLHPEDQKVTIRIRVDAAKNRCFFSFQLAATLATGLVVYLLLAAKVIETLPCYGCAIARSAYLTELSNGKKYYFNKTRVNWDEAEERCKGMGLTLATIRDETDLNATWAEAKRREHSQHEFVKGSYWWLSAKDYGKEGKYDVRWQDGSELEQNSPLWRADADKKKGCVYVDTGKLKGGACSSTIYFICELPSQCY
ncbi:C-type lectin domain family 4 member F-like [Neocloeon triangulifer]|uniref:C-type lectin domain family 4 member F-like n=1 Tax=Neocloeon triangulifer TaxID=2078957 RepID=UPI00286F7DB3|nr:C-type lectin domain family 4 member F-like [Neocloeon triangulifer]